MEYSIRQLADLAGISTRTLRYYDEVKLLSPSRISPTGYRIYSEVEVDKLQQILFYRALGISIHEIKSILLDPNYDELKALENHYHKLLEQKDELELMIENILSTLAAKKGEIKMSDDEKFKGLKRQLLEENEQQYGKEIRQTYGEAVINQSYQKFNNLDEKSFHQMKDLEEEILDKLAHAMESGNPCGQQGLEVAQLHRQWLEYTWSSYSKEAHAGLAMMYLADERFIAYYDQAVKQGATTFLSEAIRCYTGQLEHK